MSNSSLATLWVPANESNYNKGRYGNSIKAITIHHMAGKLTAKRCGELFQNPDRNATTHYGVGYEGDIAQYVDEADTAWANGNAQSNRESVTIETSNSEYGGDWPVNDITLASLIKLVADIAKRNNLYPLVKGQNVTWHSMFKATTCPGPYLFSKFDYIIDEANKIIANSDNIVTTFTPIKCNYQVYAGKWYPNVTGHDANDSKNGYAGVFKKAINAVYCDTSVGNVLYRVHTKGGGWLSEVKNREDYAGLFNKPIDGFMICSDSTTIRYKVHTVTKGWLPEVTGYDTNDSKNGYAGIFGQEIDAIMISADPIVKTIVVEKPKVETPKVEDPKVEEPKVEEPKVEEPQTPEIVNPEPEVEIPPVVDNTTTDDSSKEEVVTPPVVEEPIQKEDGDPVVEPEKQNKGLVDLIVQLINSIIKIVKLIFKS